MSEIKRTIPMPSGLTSGIFETQPEMLQMGQQSGSLFIGIPKETTLRENRVALTPSGVATLTGHGHHVIVEKDAGIRSNFTDHDYAEAGAEIAYSAAKVFKADVLLKVAPPTLDEIDLLHANQVLISPLQIPLISAEYINRLREKRVIALAMEYIKDEVGSFPIVRIMSEMAGLSVMLTAGELLAKDKGPGILLGGIAGVPPTKVVILGAGVVGEFATRTALGLGAEVRVFDNNIYKLMRLQHQVGRQLFTSAIDPATLARELVTADVAIGAIHSKSGRAPMVVSEEIVMQMKRGSVIMDVSIDQGGCFATSEVTTHDKPTFIRHDVTHYCVPNIASRVPRTASMAISNILTPMLLKVEQYHNLERLLQESPGLLHGVYTYKGCLTNHYLSQRFQIKYTELDLLITSRI